MGKFRQLVCRQRKGRREGLIRKETSARAERRPVRGEAMSPKPAVCRLIVRQCHNEEFETHREIPRALGRLDIESMDVSICISRRYGSYVDLSMCCSDRYNFSCLHKRHAGLLHRKRATDSGCLCFGGLLIARDRFVQGAVDLLQ